MNRTLANNKITAIPATKSMKTYTCMYKAYSGPQLQLLGSRSEAYLSLSSQKIYISLFPGSANLALNQQGIWHQTQLLSQGNKLKQRWGYPERKKRQQPNVTCTEKKQKERGIQTNAQTIESDCGVEQEYNNFGLQRRQKNQEPCITMRRVIQLWLRTLTIKPSAAVIVTLRGRYSNHQSALMFRYSFGG